MEIKSGGGDSATGDVRLLSLGDSFDVGGDRRRVRAVRAQAEKEVSALLGVIIWRSQP